jgi:allophanate hydrolase subunit 2
MTTDLAVRSPLPTMVDFWEGPRRDWFTDRAWALLTSAPFVVSASSNRVGVRLTGPALERRAARELPSEGLVEGALEVPPDGQPIVMLADHPVTGGYPVIAVIMPHHLPSVAQARPGTTLRFRHSGG